ncbi:hypothetical protein ACJX0J_039115, partial [Zea mays]
MTAILFTEINEASKNHGREGTWRIFFGFSPYSDNIFSLKHFRQKERYSSQFGTWDNIII